MSDPYYLSREWRALRRQVLKRDGYQCRVFSCTVGGAANLTVHHIIPRADGGGDYKENLITLCPRHHDEIEVAGVRIVALIESWESESPQDIAGMSSVILDRLERTGREKTGRLSSGITIKAPEPKGHICDASTIEALRQHKQGRTLAATAKALGFSPMFAPTISGILAGKPGAISAEGEAKLRRRLQLRTPETVTIAKSEHIPSTVHAAKIVKRNPPKRTTAPPKNEPTQPPKTTQRNSTSLHVTLSDIELFDAIASISGMRKAALFGEMVRFYATAHDLHFIKAPQPDDDQYWPLFDSISNLLAPPGDARLTPQAQTIIAALVRIGLAEGVQVATPEILNRWRQEISTEGTVAHAVCNAFLDVFPASKD